MPTPTLMIQGTTSDAGKSTLVTALCRWLKRKNINVAPFKPQNMALNSAVTIDNGEIGRAQAVQAMAAGLDAHTDMNPILIKPTTDSTAQIIVQGKVFSNMNASGFHDYKKIAKTAVLESYHRLASKHDVIVVEGAGSPAEINLREGDIANMGFAEAVDCPVILIADIDRGGVFAHLVGTLELLSKSEQQRVIGFVINRFRGDIALLKPGLDWLEQRTGKPVIGVLPYLHGLFLESEDAISLTNHEQHQETGLRVIAPVLPRISNHTDFDVLRLHPDVDFKFIGPDEDIPPADFVILPGSKNVISDTRWLREQGWDKAIQKHLRYGGKLLGICGGFQMLGKQIVDSLGIEGKADETDGLGLLDMTSHLEQEKQLKQFKGQLCFSNAEITGYEIHVGVSHGNALNNPFAKNEKQFDGAMSDDQQIIGTYLHGVFDSPTACESLLCWAGLKQQTKFNFKTLREENINLLADSVEQHLDTEFLLKNLLQETSV